MSEQIYDCYIECFARVSSRSGGYTSVKQTRERIQQLGYWIYGANAGLPNDTQLIQRVVFSGTRAECLAMRREIETTLNNLSGGMAKVFHSIRRGVETFDIYDVRREQRIQKMRQKMRDNYTTSR